MAATGQRMSPLTPPAPVARPHMPKSNPTRANMTAVRARAAAASAAYRARKRAVCLAAVAAASPDGGNSGLVNIFPVGRGGSDGAGRARMRPASLRVRITNAWSQISVRKYPM